MTIPVPTEDWLARVDADSSKRLTSLATLTKREASADISSAVEEELADHLDVVTGHNHAGLSVLSALGPRELHADVRSAQENLRLVVGSERSVAATLILGENLQGRQLGSETQSVGLY